MDETAGILADDRPQHTAFETMAFVEILYRDSLFEKTFDYEKAEIDPTSLHEVRSQRSVSSPFVMEITYIWIESACHNESVKISVM
jgi:uncharacterized Zn finger protein